MNRKASTSPALIGPNAVLQMVDPMSRHLGHDVQHQLFVQAGYSSLPSGDRMIAEDSVADLHQLLMRVADVATSAQIATEAGEATGRYILANRIPALAKRLLSILPSSIAGQLLSHAIEKHAWTFAGSGHFRIVSHRPLILSIGHNPLAGECDSELPQCHWHSAVFSTLFNTLAGNCWQVTETLCCGMGDEECRFIISRHNGRVAL